MVYPCLSKRRTPKMDESFFDHIDGLLDFPAEDIDPVFPTAGMSDSVLPSIWSESLPGSDPVSLGAAAVCDLSAELSIPYEDIVQLEWLSTFVEDSFSGGGLAFPAADPCLLLPKNDGLRPFQTSSPVSVLESSSSSSSSASLCSGEKTSPCSPDVVIPRKFGRARSKRPRPASFSPRPAMIQLLSPQPQCSVPESDHNVPVKIQCESSESFTGSYNSAIDILKEAVTVEPMTPKKKKKKKIEPTLPPRPMVSSKVEDEDPESAQAPIRKCLHCHITKTPQWRAGPLGPKTLCNACGVRYKSGRLFPEYRPAASPTFVPSLHSNSHKKVLEMRNMTGGLIIRDTLPELIPNTSAIVQMDCM